MEAHFINLLGPVSTLNVISGVCIPGLPVKFKKYQSLALCYCVFVQLLIFSQTICCIIVVCDFKNAINVVHVSTILTMFLGSLFWSTYVLLNRNRLKQIINRIDLVIEEFNKGKFGESTLFEDDLKIKFQMTKKIVTAVFISFALLPVVNNTQKLFSSLELFGPNDEKSHNYQAPWDANESPVYEYSLLIQGFSLFIACTAQGSTIHLFSVLYFILSIFFKHLQNNIGNALLWQDINKVNESDVENSTKEMVELDGTFNKRSLSSLKHWIVMHQELLSIFKDIIVLYSPYLSVYFLYIYISVAFTLFTAVQNTHTHTTVELMVLAYFSFLCLSNFYMLCSYGHYIMVQSEDVTWKVYASPWVDSSRQHKSLVNTILIRATKPLVVNCYSSTTFDLSNATFIVIVKSIVSFYLGLVQMKKQ